MAITVDLVKKLILEYIGGKPLFGNPGNVWAGKHLVAIQIPHLGALGSLTGALGQLVNEAGSALSAVQSLVQNPLGALTGEVSSLAGNVLSQVQGISGLPGAALSQVTGAVSTLQTSAQGLLDHTNILSGVVQDAETIGTNALSAGELMKVTDPSDVMQLAGALFSDGQVDSIRQSLDPNVPGGVTDTLNLLLASTDPTEQTNLADNLSKQLTDHATALDTIVTTDQAATNQYILTRDITTGTHDLFPDTTNDAQNMLFDRIATPTLKQIFAEYPDDVRNENSGDLVLSDAGSGTISITTAASRTQVPPHTHPTSDIISLLTFIQQAIQTNTFTANTAGSVPASGGANNKFLCANGSWSTVSSNGTIVTANSSAVPDRSTLATSNTAVGALYLYESGREGEFVWDNSNLSTLVTADPSQGIYVAPTSDTTGASGAWVRKFTGKADARWWGLVDNGAGASNTTALINAIAALKALEQTTTSGFSQSSPGLYIPKGTYSGLTSALVITHELHIEGDDTGAPGGGGSVLKWVAGVHGFDCQSPCKITKLSLYGGYTGTAGEFHGIKVRSPITVEDCYIDSFQGNGIDMNATSVANGGTGETAGIANGTYVRRVFIQHCKSGIYAAGSDSSACSFSQTRVFFNREYGINDESFLGNTYLQPESVGNTLSSYRTNGASQKSLFLNPYSELGQPAAIFDQRTLILGGLLSNGYTGTGAWIDTQLGIAEAFRGIVGICPDRTSSWQIGHNVSGYFGNMGSTTIQASANTTGGNYWWRGGLGGIYQRLNDSDFAFVQGWTDASDTNWHTFGFPRMYLGLGNPANGPSLAKVLVRAMSSAPSDNQGQGAFTFNQAFTGAGSSPIAWIKDTGSPTSYTPIYSGTAVQAATRTALSQLDTSIAEAYLYESGREGTFVWNSSNLSSFVTADTQKGIYVAPASDTTGASGAWVRKFSGSIDIRWFGAVADCTAIGTGTDNAPAINAAKAVGALLGKSHEILIPKATLGYRVSSTLVFNYGTKLRGQGWHENPGNVGGTGYSPPQNWRGSILVFDQNVPGLQFIDFTDNNADSQAFEFEGARYSIIEDLALYGGAGTTVTAHGIEMRTVVNMRNVRVENFGGNGLKIIANTAGAAPYGITSKSRFSHCVFNSNKCHGAYVIGTDANIMVFDSCDFSNNGGAGYIDFTTIGNNVLTGCHFATNNQSNGLGTPATTQVQSDSSLLATSTNGSLLLINTSTAPHVLVGIYIESGVGSKAHVPQGTLILGGILGQGGSALLEATSYRVGFDGFGSLYADSVTPSSGGWTVNHASGGSADFVCAGGGTATARFLPGSGTFSHIAMFGNSNSSALGLDILAGNGGAYFSANLLEFRNAAQTINYFTHDGSNFTVQTGALKVGNVTVNSTAINVPPTGTDSFLGDRLVVKSPSSGAYATIRSDDSANTTRFVIWCSMDTDPVTYFDSEQFKFENLAESNVYLTMSSSGCVAQKLSVNDDVYDASTWDTNLSVPTKNAVRDKIETLPQILSQSAVAASHTGDLTETTLATITLPAGAMGANGKVEIQARWSFSGTAGTKTPKIKFGGTAIIASNVGATITAYRHNSEVANRNATNSQYTFVDGMNSSAASLMTTGTLAIDTTASVSITITGTLANAADTITLESYQVLLYPHS